MKAEHINPVYIAAREVFENMFGVELIKGKLEVKEEIVSNNSVNVSIGITGDLQGTILFSFPEEMVFGIVEEMAGMKIKEFDKFVASAIGELGNIISGNAMSNFAEQGYNCDIVPPQITTGVNKTFPTASKFVLVIPLVYADNKFLLYITVRE